MKFYLRPDLVPPVTRESVFNAIVTAHLDRRAIARLADVQIDDDGHVVHPKGSK